MRVANMVNPPKNFLFCDYGDYKTQSFVSSKPLWYRDRRLYRSPRLDGRRIVRQFGDIMDLEQRRDPGNDNRGSDLSATEFCSLSDPHGPETSVAWRPDLAWLRRGQRLT